MRRAATDRRGVVALEFAMVGPIFILLVIFTIEVSFNLFVQSMLDRGLDIAARQLQTGSAQNAQGGNDFIASYLCPAMLGALDCSKIYIRLQVVTPTGTQDLYDFSLGGAPSSGSNLDLSSFASTGFCNPGPGEMIVVNALYISPSFTFSLLPGIPTLLYNGVPVHVTVSGVAVATEKFPPAAYSQAAASRC